MNPPRRLALAAAFLLCAATVSPTVVTVEAFIDGAALLVVDLPSLVALPGAVVLAVAVVWRRLSGTGLAVVGALALGYGALLVVLQDRLATVAMSAGATAVTGEAVLVCGFGLALAAGGERVAARVPRWLPAAVPVALVVAAVFVPVDALQRAAVRGSLPYLALGAVGALHLLAADGSAAEWATRAASWAGAALVLVGTTTGVARCAYVPAVSGVSYVASENTLHHGQCMLSPNLGVFAAGWVLLLVAPLARFGIDRLRGRPSLAQS